MHKEWADKYKGKFDDGWDAYRERVFKRAKEKGWIPQNAQLTPRHETMPSWDSVPEHQRPFQRRLMEVLAGFSEHVDVQVGRVVDEIERLGYGDNTLIFYIWGDNGSSAEGQNGTISELLAQNSIPTTVDMHIKARLDDVWEGAARLLRLKWQVGAAEVSAQNLVIFLLVLLIAYAISRLLGFILIEEIVPRIRLSRGVPDAIELLSRHTVLLVGFLLALSAAGVNLSQVTLALSALGVGIGFGLQNVVNNFVSGLILVFEHPIQVGDYVEVGSTTGVVRKIGFRVSLIHTLDGADIIIPNGELIGSKVINWSLSDRLRRVNVSVEVVLGSDPDRVIEILKKTARHHPEVLSEPEPSAVFDEFGDGSLKFTLCC